MATSVLLAECAIAPFMWKIHHATSREPHVLAVVYVDDLNFMVGSGAALRRIVELILAFRDHFALDLSATKTKIWGNRKQETQEIAREFGLSETDSLDALGASWQLHKNICPAFDKEIARLQKMETRIRRLKPLPVTFLTKCDLASMSCLSLLDYVNHPNVSSVRGLKGPLKRALGHPYAAPEVLYNVALNTTLDPELRWLLAGMRLWHEILKDNEDSLDVEVVLGGTKGRLAKIAAAGRAHGIAMGPQGFRVHDKLVPSREPWFLTKKIMLAHLKHEEWRSLMERRPDTYGGLTTCHIKAHRALLRTMNSWDQTPIVRVWTGSVMTRTKSALIGRCSEQGCVCGCELQTLRHILWECPLTEAAGEQIEFWSLLPPAQSVSHLLPHPATNKEIEAWKVSFKRAVRIIKKLARGTEQMTRREPRPRGARGHVTRISDDALYVFCGRCFISRRIRDLNWLFVKTSECAHEKAWALGETWTCQGHEAALKMAVWKTTAQRPRWECNHCTYKWWATGTCREECKETRGDVETITGE